jgi:hypothetical protein
LGLSRADDGDGLVQIPVLIKGSAEGAAHGGGVADEQQAAVLRGHHTFDGFVDLLFHPLGFIHHNEHVGAVETLKLFVAVGGQAQGIGASRQL